MNAASRNVDDVVPAWRELEARAPVKLCSIHTERHHKAMREFMNKLLDEIGDQESHPLMGLLDVVTLFVALSRRFGVSPAAFI